jgi:hypothetical protein
VIRHHAEPGAEYELTDALIPRVPDDIDDADEDEEEPAALPTSDARVVRSSSRHKEDHGTVSAINPQSDAPCGSTNALEESEF